MDCLYIKSSFSLWTALVQKVRFPYGLPSYKSSVSLWPAFV